MNEFEIIATKIFSKYNPNFNSAERAGGWTNAVWINGDLVLRLSMNKGSDKVRKETELAKLLPSIVGYPKNIENGITNDYEWSLNQRIRFWCK